jgi:hypothetical protein
MNANYDFSYFTSFSTVIVYFCILIFGVKQREKANIINRVFACMRNFLYLVFGLKYTNIPEESIVSEDAVIEP